MSINLCKHNVLTQTKRQRENREMEMAENSLGSASVYANIYALIIMIIHNAAGLNQSVSCRD